MNNQFSLPLDGPAKGEQLKHDGMELVKKHTPEQWKELFRIEAKRRLECFGSVTSEEVIEVIGMPPGHPSCIGALMHAFAKEHKLSCTYEKSRKPRSHRAIIGRWRAL